MDFVIEHIKSKELMKITYYFTAPMVKLYNREYCGLVKDAKLTNRNDLILIMLNK